MFDIGFTELLLIAVVGLLVIGPQRLPEAVRTTALWIGRIRRTITRAYREVEKEVGMDEIKRQLHNEEIMRQLSDRDGNFSQSKPSVSDGDEPNKKEP